MKRVLPTLCVATMMLVAGTARAVQPTSFTYQGELSQLGTRASGTFDFQFRLYSGATGSAQIGGTLCADDVQVADGRFSVVLDFGLAFNGDPRFLELAVRSDAGADCSDSAGFTVLASRQELTSTPYASHAATSDQASQAANAATLDGQSGSFYRNAANLTGTVGPVALGGTYSNALTFNNGSNVFVGNGLGLTGLNAANMTVGVLDPARMPTNWAAGGDLMGLFPNPSIAPGAVSDSKIANVSWFKLTGIPRSVTSAYSPWVLNQTAVGIGAPPSGQVTPPPEPLTAVACGDEFAVGLRPNGSLVSWGRVPQDPPAGDFIAVAAGGGAAAAIQRDGSIVAWGNLSGYPVPQGDFTTVVVGNRFGVALNGASVPIVWGDTASRNLNIPAGVYTKIAAGWDHIVAMRPDGTLFACGLNTFGQTNVPAGSYSQVYSCGNHGVAIRPNGTLLHWGNTEFGQISVPAGTYQGMAMTPFGGVAIRPDFTVAAWGIFGNSGAFSAPGGTFISGAGGRDFAVLIPAASISTAAPVIASGGISGSGAGLTNLNASQMTTGLLPSSALSGTYSGAVSLTSSGNSFTGSGSGLTGLNASNISSGTLAAARLPNGGAAGGDLAGSYPNPAIAAGAVTDAKVSDVAWWKITGVPANIQNVYSPWALTQTLVSAGNNGSGQASVPAGNFTAVASGTLHTLGLRQDGTVVGWGNNDFGQISVPRGTYIAIASGVALGVGLRTDGSIVQWGGFYPDDHPTTGTYKAIATGGTHALAIRTDGTLVGWGLNSFGQATCPNGTFTAIAAGSEFSIGLRTDGTLAGWGYNSEGQINVPAGTFIAIAAGLHCAAAIRTDGTIAFWGGGAPEMALVPSGQFTSLFISDWNGVAIRADGSAVGWGTNMYGQLNFPPGSYSTATASNFTTTLIRRPTVSSTMPLQLSQGLSGNGSGLTNLDASAVSTGTLADARLSSNVALRNAANTFTASNTFTSTGTTSFAGPVVATSFSGSGAALTALDAGGVATGTLADARLSSNIPRLNAASNTFTGTLSGSGSGLTSLNATNLASGTVPDGRLSTNVAMLNAASNTFTGTLNANGSGLTALNATNLASGTVGDARLSANVAMRSAANAFGNFNNTFAGNVGIGTLTPGAKLDVVGLTRTLALQVGTTASAGQVLTTDGTGTGSWQFLPAAGSGLAFAANTYSVQTDGVISTMLSGDLGSLVKMTRGGLAQLPIGQTVDRSQPNTTTTSLTAGDMWQSWTPASTGSLTAIAVQLSSTGATGTSTLSVYSGVGTAGTLLSSQPVTVVLISGGGLQQFQLATPVDVTAGQAYTFKLTSPSSTILSYGAGGTVAGMSSSISSAVNFCFRTFHAGSGTPGLAASGGLTLTGNTIELSRNITKESNAGKIGYQVFTSDALDIVGAGTTGSNRKIKLWAEGGATFTGALSVTGALSKGGGSFKIDHPLDPANKFLYHSFVESPDMMNIYNGTIITGADGYATVELPDYFEALNRDFRYQLTVIDDDAPDFFTARVASKIGVGGANTFVIKTVPGNLEVSWQVTGVRHDAWAEKNRIPNSVDKSESERGRYLHPEAFGLGADKAIGAASSAASSPASN